MSLAPAEAMTTCKNAISSGFYCFNFGGKGVPTYCDMNTDGGKWIVSYLLSCFYTYTMTCKTNYIMIIHFTICLNCRFSNKGIYTQRDKLAFSVDGMHTKKVLEMK